MKPLFFALVISCPYCLLSQVKQYITTAPAYIRNIDAGDEFFEAGSYREAIYFYKKPWKSRRRHSSPNTGWHSPTCKQGSFEVKQQSPRSKATPQNGGAYRASLHTWKRHFEVSP
jgi:hypothetical protein